MKVAAKVDVGLDHGAAGERYVCGAGDGGLAGDFVEGVLKNVKTYCKSCKSLRDGLRLIHYRLSSFNRAIFTLKKNWYV